MNFENVNRWLTLLANLGVIAGIVFLAFELRQNNQLLVAQSSYAQFNVEQQRRLMQMQESEIAVKPRESLTDAERLRRLLLYNNMLDSFVWQYREYQAGRLPEDFIDLRIWRDVWNVRGLREQFDEDRQRLDPEFVNFIETEVIQ